LIEERGDRGKWFAAAKDAGHFDIALECAATGTTEPKTLIRAARDFAESRPKFAAQVALQAVESLLEGWGYEPDPMDITEAYDHLIRAARNCEATERAHAAVEELLARQTGHDSTMRSALLAHLQRRRRDSSRDDASD